jgi:spore coat protein CotH
LQYTDVFDSTYKQHRRAAFLSVAWLLASACGVEPPPRLHPPSPPPPPPAGSGPCGFEVEPHPALELPVWDLIVEDEAWDALHEDVEADAEVAASVCIEGEKYPIELELQGSSTRYLHKKSFDLKFNRGKRLAGAPFGDGGDPGGLRKIFMKAMFYDHSLIREALAFDLFRAMGGEAPRTGFANLRINGAYWGLYVLIEPIEEDYLHRHGYPPGGNLYKAVRKHGDWADFAPGRDLALAFENEADDDAEYEEEEEKEEEAEEERDGEHEHMGDVQFDMTDVSGRADLERLMVALQETPLTEEAFLAQIDPIFPLTEYFERLIWVSWTQNGDATAQNYFLYNAPRDGHDFWYQLPWDSNLSLGAVWDDPDAVRAPSETLLLDGRNYFGERLVRVEPVRARYIERFREVLDDVLAPEVVLERFDHHSGLVEHDLAVDQERWQRNVDPNAAFEVLLDFFARRPDALRRGLTELESGVD